MSNRSRRCSNAPGRNSILPRHHECCLARLIKGPDLPDRILAMDTLYINGIALIMLFGLYLDSNLFFEAALLIAVMGFISTVAIAKHLMRGNIIE